MPWQRFLPVQSWGQKPSLQTRECGKCSCLRFVLLRFGDTPCSKWNRSAAWEALLWGTTCDGTWQSSEETRMAGSWEASLLQEALAKTAWPLTAGTTPLCFLCSSWAPVEGVQGLIPPRSWARRWGGPAGGDVLLRAPQGGCSPLGFVNGVLKGLPPLPVSS